MEKTKEIIQLAIGVTVGIVFGGIILFIMWQVLVLGGKVGAIESFLLQAQQAAQSQNQQQQLQQINPATSTIK